MECKLRTRTVRAGALFLNFHGESCAAGQKYTRVRNIGRTRDNLLFANSELGVFRRPPFRVSRRIANTRAQLGPFVRRYLFPARVRVEKAVLITEAAPTAVNEFAHRGDDIGHETRGGSSETAVPFC